MYDLIIIGGGINGVGIARDAAGRGLKVLLCERDDLAAHTSSASSKLIHGGLRYLEQYEFRLVRESLAEREVLLKSAPHIIWPMRIVLPVLKGMRPRWILRIGLFLYDHLATRAILPGTQTLNLRKTLQGKPLKPELAHGFEYSDCWADDARLVVLNAVDAKERGAEILTRTACTGLTRAADRWQVRLEDANGERNVEGRMLINAAGPWVEKVAGLAGRLRNDAGVRLVKGSHIVTRRLFEGEHGYIFQAADGRVIFAMPYEGDFTLIGTTDVTWDFGDGPAAITDAETRYLCDAVNDYFKTPITPADVVWSYAGVRPLYDDKASSASVVTRDYVFDLDAGEGRGAPLLSIFGGKLTTYRKLAEHAFEKIGPFLPAAGPVWTHEATLPGGDFPHDQRAKLVDELLARHGWLTPDHARRLATAYGTRASVVLGDAQDYPGLGRYYGADLYEAEVAYLVAHEFAQTAEDVLWRRTKLGLSLNSTERETVASSPSLLGRAPEPSVRISS